MNEQAATAEKFTAQVLGWLDQRQKTLEAQAADGRDHYAVRYAVGRYSVGLEHYRTVFGKLGWYGRSRGLDVGSGAGHWAIAFTFDNGCVTGIDRSEKFVDLANGAAAVVGLGDRIRHRVGRAEALPFPTTTFDVVWSHSVLFLCDIEDTVREIGRVLKPGGEFYCGYSSTGFRIKAIYAAVSSNDGSSLKSQLSNYVGAGLQRHGMARNPWSRLGCLTADELVGICNAFGMRLVGRPGLQDGAKDFAGIAATIDLLCVKDDEGQPFGGCLLGVSAASADGRRRYRELIRLGLGKLVQQTLERRGEALSDSDIRSLYVLAAVRAGHGERVAHLDHDGLDPLTLGLLAFDRRRIDQAIDAFAAVSEQRVERDFLLGSALLAADRTEAAVRVLERGFEAGRCPVECQFGIMLARHGTASWSEQRTRMVRVLRCLPQAMGATAGKAEELARTLT